MLLSRQEVMMVQTRVVPVRKRYSLKVESTEFLENWMWGMKEELSMTPKFWPEQLAGWIS